MPKSFVFHQDPGHGWIEVSGADLADLGLNLHHFSRYSYRSPTRPFVYYLEEDCDASKFVAFYAAKYGYAPQFVDSYKENTPIRAYRSIHD